MVAYEFKFPDPLVTWNGSRFTYREFHDNLLTTLIDPNSDFFVDNDVQFVPIGLQFHPKSDQLLVLLERPTLFVLALGKKAIKEKKGSRLMEERGWIYQLSDGKIRGVEKMPYSSNYWDLGSFDHVRATPEALARDVMKLLENIQVITHKTSEEDKRKIFMLFKEPITTVCFFGAEALRFRPLYTDSFGSSLDVTLSGWSKYLPTYWSLTTKHSYGFYDATISRYKPIKSGCGALFVQTIEDMKLLGELTEDELNLVNGQRLEGEATFLQAYNRLLKSPKACYFLVKVKWHFLQVEILENPIRCIICNSRLSAMTAENIHGKLKETGCKEEVSEVTWVLCQLVKLQKLVCNDHLYSLIN